MKSFGAPFIVIVGKIKVQLAPILETNSFRDIYIQLPPDYCQFYEFVSYICIMAVIILSL